MHPQVHLHNILPASMISHQMYKVLMFVTFNDLVKKPMRMQKMLEMKQKMLPR